MTPDQRTASRGPTTVPPDHHRTAWDHPPTQRAWARHMITNFVSMTGWAATWFGTLFLVAGWCAWWSLALVGVLGVYAVYRAVVQIAYVGIAAQMQRILRDYPWQLVGQASYGLGSRPDAAAGAVWVALPDPGDPDGAAVPLLFRSQLRRSWWIARMRPRAKAAKRAQLEPLWFAGDPRFFGVIAVSGRRGAPRRLHRLGQPGVFQARTGADRRGASAEDVDRARRAGAYIRDPHP